MIYEQTIELTRLSDGESGQSNFIHIKYSNDGISFTSNDGEDIGTWIGIYTDNSEEDSTDFSKYKWSKIVGEDGATGTGIESITIEFYLSTSKTEQVGGEWSEKQPEWSTGKYLWTRDKIVYKNPTSTVYTTPYCDSSWEAANAVDEKLTTLQTDFEVEQGKIESLIKETTIDNGDGTTTSLKDAYNQTKQTVEGNTTTIANVQTKVNDLTGDVESMDSRITTVETTADGLKTTVSQASSDASSALTSANQTASKFSWIVESGSSATDFILTDRTASLVADYINLNGKVTFSGLDSSAQSKIDNAQSSADTANSKIDNLQIGGRNLLTKAQSNMSNWYNYMPEWVTIESTGYDNKLIYKTLGSGWEVIYLTLSNLEIGKVYSLGFDYEVPVAYENYSFYKYGVYIKDSTPQSNAPTDVLCKYVIPNTVTSKTRGTLTFEATATTMYVVLNGGEIDDGQTGIYFNFGNWKLELGNKATDWTPAPEDKADQSVLDAWNSDTVESDITTINGGYIRTNSITTNQLNTDEIYGNSAFIGAIQATQLNADMITAGTIKSNLLNLYGFKMLNKTTNQESLSITDTGSITMRGSIESYNYHSGKTGWAINSTTDNAEFNNVTVRGSVITNDGGIVGTGGTSVNLQINSSFTSGSSKLDGWYRNNTFAVDTSVTYQGVNSVKFNRTSSSTPASSIYIETKTPVSCTVGYAYTASAKFYTENKAGISGTSQPYLSIYFYNSSGSVVKQYNETVTFIDKSWLEVSVTGTCPSDAVSMGMRIQYQTSPGTFWFAQPKLEEGDVATDWSLAPEDKIKQVRFWAGTSYEERESAPFIVYNDGFIKATQGNFSGVFSGTVDIGNIKITDPSATAGGDALLTIQNGDNGIKRVQLRDTGSSAFAQSVIVSDNAYNTMIELGQNGYGTFKGGINVNSKIYLEGSHLTINGNELTTNSYGFLLNSSQVDVGTVNNTSVLNVYGQSNVNGELKVTKLINYNDTVVATIIAGSSGGIDWDFVV